MGDEAKTQAAVAGAFAPLNPVSDARYARPMTVKEQLAARVARMSEEEAAETLRILDRRQDGREPELRKFVEANRLASPLSDDQANDLVYEELRAVRQERRGAA
jgi:hypothetical protein